MILPGAASNGRVICAAGAAAANTRPATPHAAAQARITGRP
jgi:hypothetical protein